jgi:RNA polymerase sigma-70 factor (ECF subfamily)
MYMEDFQIIELYWQRDERAIDETSRKYGPFCHTVAMNVLGVREDAEECVNDTWHSAWNAMPPQRPRLLRPWLGRIVRNAAINLWNKNHAKKRYVGMELLLDELEACIPSPQTIERQLEAEELGGIISAWLRTLPADDRTLFVRRYWNGEALRELARLWHDTPARLAQRTYRLRLALKAELERNGVFL